MQKSFSCDIRFEYNPESQQLTIRIVPDREGTGVVEEKSITLENPNELKPTLDVVLREFKSMLPGGMYISDSAPLIEELKNVLLKEENNA